MISWGRPVVLGVGEGEGEGEGLERTTGVSFGVGMGRIVGAGVGVVKGRIGVDKGVLVRIGVADADIGVAAGTGVMLCAGVTLGNGDGAATAFAAGDADAAGGIVPEVLAECGVSEGEGTVDGEDEGVGFDMGATLANVGDAVGNGDAADPGISTGDVPFVATAPVSTETSDVPLAILD